jgi:hypothetical protein
MGRQIRAAKLARVGEQQRTVREPQLSHPVLAVVLGEMATNGIRQPTGAAMTRPPIGSVVKLIHPCLGNLSGTLGFVYEHYDLGAGPSMSIIFENGNYDGFSPVEMDIWIAPEPVRGPAPGPAYQFTNVFRLGRDFDGGIKYTLAKARREQKMERR